MVNQPMRSSCGLGWQSHAWLLLMCLTLAACANYTGEGRTPGEFIDDGYIERTVLDLIREAQQDLDDTRIKVVSMDAIGVARRRGSECGAENNDRRTSAQSFTGAWRTQ